MTKQNTLAAPTLKVWDAVGLIVGIVIGAAIFETPATVASNMGNTGLILLTWILGGGVSFVGALCYAELTTTYPNPGGSYYYLQRSFGQRLAFLFAWARLAVIQTGSIALLAFVFGDYMSQLYRLGTYSNSIYAAIAILALTLLNWLGIRQSTLTQNALAILQVGGLLLVCFAGFFLTPGAAPPVTALPTTSRDFGLTMVFVLLTYGGWSEAAYLSSELRNAQRNMVRSLFWSLSIITGLYVLINLALLHGLGILSMASSNAVAADLMRQAFGEPGVVFISGLVAVTTLCSINASIFTGARTNYALGRDFLPFAWMGRWDQASARPHNPNAALWVQSAIALILVGLGSFARRGFESMVNYTAPVFWFFFLLTGISLFVLRQKDPHLHRPFRVPFYPIVPILFCLVSAYMLYSSLVYTEWHAILGVAVLLAGIPLLWLEQRMRQHHKILENKE